MIHCQLCGKLIINEEANKHYKITLGNIFSGKFYGEKDIYYHRECLESLNEPKKEIFTELY